MRKRIRKIALILVGSGGQGIMWALEAGGITLPKPVIGIVGIICLGMVLIGVSLLAQDGWRWFWKQDRKMMGLAAVFSGFLLGTLVTGSLLLRRVWVPYPALVLVTALHAPSRPGTPVPNARDSISIEVGVTNVSKDVVREVEVTHLYNAQKDMPERYPIHERLHPRNASADQYRVSINPGETAYFKFGDYVILEGDVRRIQFPFEHMSLRPGHGPDQGGFPYEYRIGLQVSGEHVPASEAVFRLTMSEQGYSFVREKEKPRS